MEQTTAEQIRGWRGPALFSYGFRPFFLFGALWSALAMALWALTLSGGIDLPTRFDPASWHAHAFLFGYLSAVIAGFLLTAVPNWTGRLPVVGWQLAGLFALWAVGRVAVLCSTVFPIALVAAVDLAFPVVLGGVILREIVASKNWRNLMVLGLLAVFTLANLIFHIEAALGAYPAQGVGLRLGVASVLMMVCVIGGRIVPSFTRNWLAKSGHPARPAPPMQTFDKFALVGSVIVFGVWVIAPHSKLTGAALMVLSIAHLARLIRWKGQHTGAEPLVWILHVAYALVPLGAALVAVSILMPDHMDGASALHVWMAGALALMTLAVMTRATLGHTGQALLAGRGTVAIYGALVASVGVRLAAGVWPLSQLYSLSAVLWILAFVGFAALYGPALVNRQKDRS